MKGAEGCHLRSLTEPTSDHDMLLLIYSVTHYDDTHSALHNSKSQCAKLNSAAMSYTPKTQQGVVGAGAATIAGNKN